MIISITGTPGTGKTTLSKKLSDKLHYEHVELNKIIQKKKLYESYDNKRKCYVVDTKKMVWYFKKRSTDKNMIFDSHLSHFLKSDIVIVLRCRPGVLEKRLKKKKWNSEKIRENVEAEMIGLISWEARKSNRNVYDVDTTRGKALNNMLMIIKGKGNKYRKQIDWL